MTNYSFGTSGWSYPDWEGVVYPRPQPNGFERLNYLARFLDLVEVNSSFYHPPSNAVCRGWLSKTREKPGFRFVVKLWQRFTHQHSSATEADHQLFSKGVSPLLDSDRWAGLLIQFPWSFVASQANRDYLLQLLYRYREWKPFVEFRHQDWHCTSVRKDLVGLGSGLVNLDQPFYDRAYPLTCDATTDTAYFRLHGRNQRNWFDSRVGRDGRYDYLYSPIEIEQLKARLNQFSKMPKNVLLLANNHFRGQAMCNVLQLKAAIRQEKVLAPECLRQHFPQLADLSYAESEIPKEVAATSSGQQVGFTF